MASSEAFSRSARAAKEEADGWKTPRYHRCGIGGLHLQLGTESRGLL
jgi:hypothetical protein